ARRNGSQTRPPPQPTSSMRRPASGAAVLASRPNWRQSRSLMKPRRIGFRRWSGASGPSGFHHSSAMSENRAISPSSTLPARGFVIVDPVPAGGLVDLAEGTGTQVVWQALIIHRASKHHAVDNHRDEGKGTVAATALAGREILGKDADHHLEDATKGLAHGAVAAGDSRERGDHWAGAVAVGEMVGRQIGLDDHAGQRRSARPGVDVP